jgi:hypothetical protein
MRVLVVYKTPEFISFYSFFIGDITQEILERGHAAKNIKDLSETDQDYWNNFQSRFDGNRVYSDEHHKDILVDKFRPPIEQMYYIDLFGPEESPHGKPDTD